MSEFPTLQDIVLAAKQKLPNATWDFLTYGSETETTVRRNRRALDSLALVPRIMRDVSEIDIRTSLLGMTLRMPVVLAPVGSIALFDPDGALAAARAVEDFGIAHIVSGYADPGFEAVAKGCKAQLIYAFHPRYDWPFVDDLVDRVVAAGYRAIAFVAEAAYYSRRERDLMSGIQTKAKRTRPYAEWLGLQREERAAGKIPSKEGLLGTVITWEMFDRVKRRSNLPILLKGVTCAADAVLAREHGADVIYVSNHGGRAIDHGRGSVESLAEVIDAVGRQCEVIVDGGFVRGTDVLKAISLGAKAVAMGRMQSWALAASGQAGLARALAIIEEEIIVNMGLLGVNRLDELDRHYLAKTDPVAPAHPLSAFPVALERIGG